MSETARPCVIRGESIGAAFLPDTLFCITHAWEAGRLGGEFVLVVRNTSLGKSGSLKKNHGDVHVERRRNYNTLEGLRQAHRATKAR